MTSPESEKMQRLDRPPRASKQALLFSCAALLFCGLVLLGYRLARDDSLAKLTEFSGPAYHDTRSEMGTWLSAELGTKFQDGDGAKTAPAAIAQFRLRRGARLTLKPASQIRFGRRGQGQGAVGLTVEVGEVDVRTADGSLQLSSQFGELVIEPNSAVHLKKTGAHLLVSVELGSLELGAFGAKGRRLASGESLTVEVGGLIVENAARGQAAQAPLPPIEAGDLERGDGLARVDLSVDAGQSFVVHDPKPPTAIGLRLGSVCAGEPARLTSAKLKTESRSQGNLSFGVGVHRYQVRCLARPDVVRATGEIRVLRDSGARQLPTFTPSANVTTDGRRYTVMYQSHLPRIAVTWPTAPAASSFTLDVDGRRYPARSAAFTLAAGTLGAGTHRLTFSAATSPPRQSRQTTVVVQYDAQAPAARLSEPLGDFPAGSAVTIAGQVLPGWTVSLFGKSLPVDGSRQFRTDISTTGALPIAFSHPEQGIHYYLRRPQGLTPE